MLVVAYLMRTGRVTDLHMSATNERHIPCLLYTSDVYKRQIKASDGLRAMVTMMRDRLGMTPVFKPGQPGVNLSLIHI